MISSNEKGFSLVEIMIALVVGSIMLAGAYQVLSAVLSSSAQSLRISQLNQQMRAVMGLMSQDLQRTGYWADALNQDPTTNPNPFGFTVNASGDCIAYSYDNNRNTSLETTEQIGFRLSGTGTVQWAKGSGGASDCGIPWTGDDLNDPQVVTIDQLTFTTPPAECTNLSTVPRSNCNPCDTDYQPWSAGDTLVKIPRIDITLSGYLTADPAVRSTLTNTVRVRNAQIEIAASAGPAAGTGC